MKNYIPYYEDIMMWLVDYCKRHHIEINFVNYLDPKAKSYAFRLPKVIYFNDKWFRIDEKPFLLAHEIGHTMCAREDMVKSSDSYCNKSKNECKANRFAIRLLRKYCEENDIFFDSVYNFASFFGIPSRCFYILEEACC